MFQFWFYPSVGGGRAKCCGCREHRDSSTQQLLSVNPRFGTPVVQSALAFYGVDGRKIYWKEYLGHGCWENHLNFPVIGQWTLRVCQENFHPRTEGEWHGTYIGRMNVNFFLSTWYLMVFSKSRRDWASSNRCTDIIRDCFHRMIVIVRTWPLNHHVHCLEIPRSIQLKQGICSSRI